MKVPLVKASQKVADPFQTSRCVPEFAEGRDDNSDPRAKDAFGFPPKELRLGQQIPLRAKKPLSDRTEDRQLLLHLTQSSSGHLILETAPILKGSKEALLEAISPLIQQQILRFSDMHISETPSLTPKAGRVQKARTQISLPLRRKRSRSHASLLSEKRPRASREHSIATSTGNGLSTAQQSEVNTPCLESDIEIVDEPETDDEVLVVIEDTEAVRVSDRARLDKFYCNALEVIGQTQGKKILKEWVKLRQPKKQSRYPYNGGQGKTGGAKKGAKKGATKGAKKGATEGSAEDAGHNEMCKPIPENPGRHTAPPWWPSQDGHKQGRGCRHREADHLLKGERLYLMPIMLRFTGSPYHPDDFTIALLKDKTNDIGNNEVQSAILDQVYQIREAEQAFEEGGMDGDTCVYVTKHKRAPTKRQKKAEKKKAREKVEKKKAGENGKMKQSATRVRKGKRVQRESQARQSFAEHSTPTTPKPSRAGSIIESVDSSFSSHLCSSASMSGRPAYDMSYPHSPQGPSGSGYPNAPFLEDYNSPMMMSPGAEYNDTLVTAPDATMPFFPGSQMAFQPTGRGRTLDRYGNSRPRRYMSVARQASSSYDNGIVPLSEAYNFNDDQSLGGFKMKRVSHGRPTEGLMYPITSPINHPHGLPPEQQQRICAMYNCSLSHSHGFRPLDEQAHICAELNCTMNPGSHPMVFPQHEHFQAMPDQQYATGMPASTLENPDIRALMEAPLGFPAAADSFH
ncbi:MAG: hypothetical protein Q9212_002532 [Teloschistes hypoglaucus]